MEDQSLLEKLRYSDSSQVRLSESRLKFKPVLVKKLLANESDDDSDDPTPNSENSCEESDFDDFQPLPEGSFKEEKDKNDSLLNVAKSKEEEPSSVEEKEIKIENNYSQKNTLEQSKKKKEEVTNSHSSLRLTLQNTHIRDQKIKKKLISEKTVILSDSPTLKIVEPADKNSNQASCNTKIHKKESSTTKNNNDFQSKPKSPKSNQSFQNTDYKLKVSHLFEQPNENIESLQSSKFSFLNNEVQAYQLTKQHVTNTNSEQIQNLSHLSNASHAVLNTPIKSVPNVSFRPTPCLSQRNVFQTPQSKLNDNDFSKNSLQTPATIFSHWSQQHLPQTPMQNQILQTRESLKTPAGNIQSQSSRVDSLRFII